MALIVVMVSGVYTYLHTHQVEHIKYIQIFYVNHTLRKWFKIYTFFDKEFHLYELIP